MKKALLAVMLLFFCALVPVSANTENEQNKTSGIIYNEEGIPEIDLRMLTPSTNIDLSKGLVAEHAPMEMAFGDVIYNNYYVTVPARQSVDMGIINFAYAGDRLLIEWDGATQLNPQMDIVIAYSDGTQFSVYESLGYLMSTNAGSVILNAGKASKVHIWLRSLNYSDVVFYRVTLADGAQ